MQDSSQPLWVIQTAFVGDIILTLPFVHELCRITESNRTPVVIVTTASGIEIIDVAKRQGLSHYADRIHPVLWEKKKSEGRGLGILKFSKNLSSRLGKPQTVFCLQRGLRSALLAYSSGAPERVGFSTGGAAAFFYSLCVRREWDTGRHEIEKNLDLLRAWAPGSSLPPWITPEQKSLLRVKFPQPDQRVRAATQGPFVALSLGSPWATKRWPVRHAAELSRSLTAKGITVKLLGDKTAQPLAAELILQNPSLLVEDLTGKTSIADWIDQISNANFLVSGDSAAVHVASDLGVPVVALFGPTLPEFGFAPWRKSSTALGIKLDCRPCHIHGPRVCPKGHHKCLENLDDRDVYRVLEKFEGLKIF